MKKRSVRGLLMSVTFFVMTICIFGPFELYIQNQSEFWFGFPEIVKISVLMSLVSFGILFLGGILLRGKPRSFYSMLLFGLTLCLYLQGNVLNIDYGILDGKSIDWDAYGLYAALNTAVWLIIIAACVLLWKKKRKLFLQIRKYASMFLIATQTLTLCVLLTTSGVFGGADDESFYVSDRNLYTLGQEDNIVLFVLDAFDEAYLEEIFADEPEKYQEIFEGFTHYTNATVGGAPTFSALPILITGEYYPGEKTYKDYLAEAFDSDGLYTELKRQGYTVNLYTDQDYIALGASEYVDNLITGRYEVNSELGLAQKYSTLTLYKYVPHIFKRYFWLYTGDFDAYKTADGEDHAAYAMDDVQFYNNLITEGLKIEEGKTFSLIHTTGAHPPYNMDEFAERAENTSAIEKAKGQLVILNEYLNQMKKMGVYDNSTVIITCDHGQVNLARGMLMIKVPFADEFKETDAPVSHFDFHNTVFELLGIEKGDSFFDVEEDSDRVRMYYLQDSKNGSFYMTEHTIIGNPKSEEHIRPTGKVFAPEYKKNKYRFGEKLTFGADGTINPYIEKGMNALRIGYEWTDGNETIFRIGLESKPQHDLELRLSYTTAYLDICNQNLRIFVDNSLLFSELLTSNASRTISIDIPAELAEDHELVIRFEMPDAKNPAEYFGKGYDSLALCLAMTGMCISEIDLSSVPKYTFGEKLTFGVDTNAADYICYGIASNNSMPFSWTSNHEALMRIPLKERPEGDLQAVLNLTSVYTTFGNQRVRIMVNGEQCFEGVLDSAKDIAFTIPKEAITSDALMLRIYLPDAKNPYLLTGEGDRRTLGLALTGLTITEQ